MKPVFLSLTVKGKTRRHELVADELVTVGRASSCRIQVSDSSVSREHCVVIYTDGKICINDLQSTQGITHRGERVGRVELMPGDECWLGKVSARYEAPAAVSAAAADTSGSASPAAPVAPTNAAPKSAPKADEPDGREREAPAEHASTIAGYRLHEKIGEGGFGVVYRAEQTKLRREVALKVLKKSDDAEDAQRVQEFLDEARLAAQLTAPNLVQIYDVGESDGEHFLSMELVEGGSLAQRIRREGPLDWPQVLRLLRDMAEALQVAHNAELVHRDVKPGNVLLTQDGSAKLTDLGLAAAEAHAGTIAFMAPEQLRREPLDGRTDIYALGCTAYTALAGSPPFSGDRKQVAQAHVKQAPPSLLKQGVQVPYQLHQLIVHAMMAKDPADRPEDAGALLRRIDRLILPSNVVADVSEDRDDDYPSVAPRRRVRTRQQPVRLSARLAGEAIIFSMITAVVIAMLLVLKALSPDIDIYRLIGR